MSLFSNQNNFPEPTQRPLNLVEDRLPTNQQARPLPTLYGTKRLGGTFLDDVISPYANPVEQEIKLGDDITIGHNFYGGFALAFCCGGPPVDQLHEIFIDGVSAWKGLLVRSGDMTTATISGRGDLNLYWGTETQSLDSTLSGSGRTHTPYKQQCYGVFPGFFWGYNRPQVPQIEIVISRWPICSFLSGDPNVRGDCNPAHIVADLLCNPLYGLGLNSGEINASNFDSVASDLSSKCFGLSPVFGRTQSAREAIESVLDAIDGYIYTGSDGRLMLGLLREIECGTVATEFDESSLTKAPELEFTEGNANKVTVQFSNSAREYKEDFVDAFEGGSIDALGSMAYKSVNRPAVTRQAVAAAIAQAMAVSGSLAQGSGNIVVRRALASGLNPGDAFRLHYAHLGLEHLTCRITEIEFPGPEDRQARIRFSVERGYVSSALEEQSDESDYVEPEYEARPFVSSKYAELPYDPSMPLDAKSYAYFFAQRTHGLATRFNVHRKKTNGGFELEQTVRRFSRRALLFADYGDRHGQPIDETGNFEFTLQGIDLVLPDVGRNEGYQNDLLCWVGNEILSLFDATLIAPGRYKSSVIRGRYDTKPENHLAGAECWIVRRRDMEALKIGDGDNTIKAAEVVLGSQADLSEIDESVLTATGRSQRPLEPVNLAVNERTQSAIYSSGSNVRITWSNRVQRNDFFCGWVDGVTDRAPHTKLDFYDDISAFRGTVLLGVGFAQYELTPQKRLELFGGEIDFTVKAYHVYNGLDSINHSQIMVALA